MAYVEAAAVRAKAGYPRLLQTRLKKTEGGYVVERDLPESCKRVYDVLADHANNKGVLALSLAEIAAAAGYTTQTVRTATRRLAKCRLLLIERTANGPGAKLRYCLRFFYRVFLMLRNALRKAFCEFSTDKGIVRPYKVLGDNFKNPKDAPAPTRPSALMGRLRRIVQGNDSLTENDGKIMLSCIGQLVKQGRFDDIRNRWHVLESHVIRHLLATTPAQFVPGWAGASSNRERFRVFRKLVCSALKTNRQQEHSEPRNRVNARMRSLHEWAQSVDEWTNDRREWYREREAEILHELEALNLSREAYRELIGLPHWSASLCLQ